MTTMKNQPSRPRAGGDGGEPDSPDRSAGGAGQAQDAAQQAAAQVQAKAKQAGGQAQAKLREQLASRSTQTAEQINQQAADLRSVSDALREQGKDGPADAAERLAGYAERVGGYLSDKDADALLADAEQFGRDRPWAAALGGIAVGLVASRFLKASSRQRYQSRSTRPSQAGPAPRLGGSAVGEPSTDALSASRPDLPVPAGPPVGDGLAV